MWLSAPQLVDFLGLHERVGQQLHSRMSPPPAHWTVLFELLAWSPRADGHHGRLEEEYQTIIDGRNTRTTDLEPSPSFCQSYPSFAGGASWNVNDGRGQERGRWGTTARHPQKADSYNRKQEA